MKTILKPITITLISLPLLWATVNASALTGREIMDKVDQRPTPKTQQSDMEMILIDKNNSKRVRQLRSLLKDYGDTTKSILLFKTPKDVKNTGFLSFDYDESAKDDDQWLYLPALGKSKRIASSDKSGAFMGSDFSYSDMSQRDLDEYEFKLLKESKIKDVKVWIVESIPKTKKTIDETGYTKSVVYVRQDNFMVTRGIFYQQKPGRKKLMNVTGIRQQDGYWVADEMHMISKEGKRTIHQTKLRYRNLVIDKYVKDGDFTLRRLQQGI